MSVKGLRKRTGNVCQTAYFGKGRNFCTYKQDSQINDLRQNRRLALTRVSGVSSWNEVRIAAFPNVARIPLLVISPACDSDGLNGQTVAWTQPNTQFKSLIEVRRGRPTKILGHTTGCTQAESSESAQTQGAPSSSCLQ